MSYNLALILSFPFLMQIMLFYGDLAIVQAINNQLDSLALTVSIQISQKGTITDEIKSYVSKTADASIYCVSGCSGYLGDVVTYCIYKKYEPIIISSDEMFITVTRSTVIGYYS